MPRGSCRLDVESRGIARRVEKSTLPYLTLPYLTLPYPTDGGQTILLRASVPPGLEVVASSYGRGSWPRTVFFSAGGVPVLPWYATLNETRPWVLPASVADDPAAHVELPDGAEGERVQ